MALRRRGETGTSEGDFGVQDGEAGPPRDQSSEGVLNPPPPPLMAPNDPGLVHPPTAPPPPGVPGPGGNSTTPRDFAGASEPTSTPPSPRITNRATPSRPMEPEPVASSTPQPFQPMPQPGGGGMMGAMASGGAPPGIFRRGVVPGGPNAQSSMLLGKAGGLMGGGLGVPSVYGSNGDDISDLILTILKNAGR